MSQLKNTEEELKGLSKKELLGVINILKKKFNISSEELQNTTSKKDLNEIEIPTSIFVKELGSLECIVKYLKEELNLTYHEIAKKLQRDDRTIWGTYDHGIKKHRKKLSKKKESYKFPVSLIKNRKLSVLENIVKYLKEELNLTYHEIALCLKRNEKTVWTVYARARKKLK